MFEVEELVAAAGERGNEHVVITGGEPMIFTAVAELCDGLKAYNHTITIETAGTEFMNLPCDLMSISPKLSNSTPDESSGCKERHEETRKRLDSLVKLIETYNCQLKFVVDPEAGDGDIAEIEELLAKLPPVSKDRVLLMPEGTDAETLRLRMHLLVHTCIEKGWRLAPRLHVELFGSKRGT